MPSHRLEKPEIDLLFGTLRGLGHGTISRVERKLGWPPKSLSKRAKDDSHRPGGLRLRELKQVLAAAGIHPRWFFSRLYGSETALDRFVYEGRHLAFGSYRKSLPKLPETHDPTSPDQLRSSDLRRIDDLRWVDPQAAAKLTRRLAEDALSEGRIRDASLAMACRASALRLLLRFHEAHACFGWAFEAMPKERRYELWDRASYIAGDYGDFADAKSIVESALIAYSAKADLPNLARTLASYALWNHYLGFIKEAVAQLESALKLLPTEDIPYQSMIRQMMAMFHLKLGNLRRATKLASDAVSAYSPPGILGAQYLWLCARIEVSSGRLGRAEKLLESTITRLIERSPGDAALASCELARVYREAGKPQQAVELCTRMLEVVRPCGNRIIAATITDLAKSALRGTLDQEVIIKAFGRIEGALQRARRATRPAATP